MEALTKEKAPSPQKVFYESVANMIDEKKPSLKALLPAHVDVERFAKSAFMAVIRDPKLLHCDKTSLITSIINAAELGLDFTPAKGHAYLVPYKNNKLGITEIQFMPGWRGLVNLALRSKKYISFDSHTVKENDKFEIEYGLNPNLIHIPAKSNRGEIIGAYAVVTNTDGTKQFLYMGRDELEKVRLCSKAKYPGNPYESWPEEMAKKAPVRRICKRLELSPELERAIEYDNEAVGILEEEKPQKSRSAALLESLKEISDAEFNELENNSKEEEKHESIKEDGKLL